MIKLEANGFNESTMTLTLSPFDLIRLQTGLAYAMTNLETHIRKWDEPNNGLNPARKAYWEGELAQTERDWCRLQAILDDYNNRL